MQVQEHLKELLLELLVVLVIVGIMLGAVALNANPGDRQLLQDREDAAGPSQDQGVVGLEHGTLAALHLVHALASCDETTDHLETLFETNSLSDQPTYERLHALLQLLGKKINVFFQSIERGHRSEK